MERVRKTAPREREEFELGGVKYVARRGDWGVEIVPSRFKAMTYTVTGSDGSECVAEFVHIE